MVVEVRGIVDSCLREARLMMRCERVAVLEETEMRGLRAEHY